MVWILRFHPAVKKDLRRLSREARNFIICNSFPELEINPYQGEQLHGPLKGFRKVYSGEYRIAYSIDNTRKEVVIIDVGSRGGFYERLRHRLGK